MAQRQPVDVEDVALAHPLPGQDALDQRLFLTRGPAEDAHPVALARLVDDDPQRTITEVPDHPEHPELVQRVLDPLGAVVIEEPPAPFCGAPELTLEVPAVKDRPVEPRGVEPPEICA